MLRADGVGVPQQMIRRHVALTADLAEWVRADRRFEIVAPAPLNLLCLRLRDDDPAAADAATDALVASANASGAALFTRTVLDGRVALRFSIGGRSTERRHVRAGWELLQALAG
jgi:aromatic-L-amino-acid decarboxylase